MNKLYAKIAATAASVVLMGGLFAPSVLADDLTISGNGAGSVNQISVTSVSNCNVSQSNSTSAWIGVTSSASTGGNQANGNTGSGGVSIGTGNATTTTTVTVTGGDNIAVNPCCCPTPCVDGGCCQDGVTSQSLTPTSVTISGNGVGSVNGVVQSSVKNANIAQAGSTHAGVSAKSKIKTGKNQANGNTGPGTVGVTTGNGTSTTTVGVSGGSNILN